MPLLLYLSTALSHYHPTLYLDALRPLPPPPPRTGGSRTPRRGGGRRPRTASAHSSRRPAPCARRTWTGAASPAARRRPRRRRRAHRGRRVPPRARGARTRYSSPPPSGSRSRGRSRGLLAASPRRPGGVRRSRRPLPSRSSSPSRRDGRPEESRPFLRRDAGRPLALPPLLSRNVDDLSEFVGDTSACKPAPCCRDCSLRAIRDDASTSHSIDFQLLFRHYRRTRNTCRRRPPPTRLLGVVLVLIWSNMPNEPLQISLPSCARLGVVQRAVYDPVLRCRPFVLLVPP